MSFELDITGRMTGLKLTECWILFQSVDVNNDSEFATRTPPYHEQKSLTTV